MEFRIFRHNFFSNIGPMFHYVIAPILGGGGVGRWTAEHALHDAAEKWKQYNGSTNIPFPDYLFESDEYTIRNAYTIIQYT
jgi:hypothetical protein